MSAQLATNREIVSHQLRDCSVVVINSVNCLNALRNSKDEPEDTSDAGGAEEALEVVIMKACERIESIFDNKALWDLPVNDVHHIGTAQLVAQLRVLNSQAEAVVSSQQLAALFAGVEEPAPEPKKRRKPRKAREA